MAFRFDKKNSLRAESKRLAGRQLRKAWKSITNDPDALGEAVHDIRRCLKRLRALLRLERPALGSKRYRQLNEAVRDAARPVSEVRDAKVTIEALDKLIGRQSEKNFLTLRAALVAEQALIVKKATQECVLAGVERFLRQEQNHLDDWQPRRADWTLLRRGINKVFRQCRRAWEVAKEAPTPENLHEWRKQAKYMLHQSEMLRGICNEMKKRRARFDRLARLLGDDHDLVLLQRKAQTLMSSVERTKLMKMLNPRRQMLLKKAFKLGQSLFQKSG